MKTDSVARGGATIMLARVIGMGCSFFLFLLLARNSAIDAGVFRSVATYMLISEALGLLGTQRWLTVEVAPAGPRRLQLFLAGCALSLFTAGLIALVYLGISFSGLYGEDISRGLRLAVLFTIPAALYTNAQSTLVGIGFSQRMGWLNLLENAIRSSVSIAFVLAGLNVLHVIAVFVVCRWFIAFLGLFMVFRQLHGKVGWPRAFVLRELLAQVPRFALIMTAFLLMRNIALVLLPILVDEREVALFAVPYQLYDLALLVPTILALSTNFVFARQAARGAGALRWVVVQLWSITSVFLLPLVMLVLVFGPDLLHLLFGPRYDASIPALYLLILTAPLMALDQVLSQAMQASKRFRQDAISVYWGALLVLVGTLMFGASWGATGAALTLLVAMLLVLFIRFFQLRGVINAVFMLKLIWRPVLACFLVGGGAWMLRHFILAKIAFLSSWGWIAVAFLAFFAYVLLLSKLGGFKVSKRGRIRKFLFIRHEALSN